MESETVSLSRDLPPGLGLIINAFIRDVPRESVVNTLRSTRVALIGE